MVAAWKLLLSRGRKTEGGEHIGRWWRLDLYLYPPQQVAFIRPIPVAIGSFGCVTMPGGVIYEKTSQQ